MNRFRILVTLLVLTLFANTAWAKPSAELLRHVPNGSPLILGIEMGKVRSTFLFGEAMKFMHERATPTSLLGFILSKKAFDIEKDVAAAVFGFASAPTNPQAPPPAAMAVVEGTFDPARVRSAVEAAFGKLSIRKEGAVEIFSTGGVDFAFTEPTTLVIADQAYAGPTWKAVADTAHAASSNADTQALIGLIDTTRGVWLAMNTRGVPTPAGPPTDGAGVSMDLRGGLALDFRTKFAKAEDANKALEQFQAMKKQDKDPMVDMLGAKPLIDNMVAKVEQEKILTMKTSMNDGEVRAMLVKLKKMNEQPPPIAPSKGSAAQPAQPPAPGQGVKADFN